LRLRADGRLAVTLKTAWRDGTTHLVFEPAEFLGKLAALTPRREINLLLDHGVLAPHAQPALRGAEPDETACTGGTSMAF
jgi:hypothetical protein